MTEHCSKLGLHNNNSYHTITVSSRDDLTQSQTHPPETEIPGQFIASLQKTDVSQLVNKFSTEVTTHSQEPNKIRIKKKEFLFLEPCQIKGMWKVLALVVYGC